MTRKSGSPRAQRTITVPAILHPRRLAWAALVVVTVVVAVMFVVVPATSWFELRSEVESRRSELSRLEAETVRLEQRILDLQTDEEIERIARSEYNLVYPDEEAYAVLPPPVLAEAGVAE